VSRKVLQSRDSVTENDDVLHRTKKLQGGSYRSPRRAVREATSTGNGPPGLVSISSSMSDSLPWESDDRERWTRAKDAKGGKSDYTKA